MISIEPLVVWPLPRVYHNVSLASLTIYSVKIVFFLRLNGNICLQGVKLKVLDLNIARSLNEYMKYITETPCLDKLGYSLDNNSSRNIPWA